MSTRREMLAIRLHQHGGPGNLRPEHLPVPAPGPGEALVRLAATGVNFLEVYQRTGLYAVPLPATLGGEGAGVVELVGAGVAGLRAGDRVAWAGGGFGAYAEYAVVAASKLVAIPQGVATTVAAAVMLQGMTAHYLSSSVRPLHSGDRCLVHAAAGGVGLLLVQLAKRRGAYVIGTAGTDAKADLARAAGADHVIVYTSQDFVTEVRRITDGAGVHVVYDSVGQSTCLTGLDALAPRGTMVLFGQSSGPVEAIDPLLLSRKGSLFLTRPTLNHYTATREELLWRAGEVLSWVEAGELTVRIGAEFPLHGAADAHRALESRQTAGKVLLRP